MDTVRFVNFKSKRKFGIEIEVSQKVKPTELVKAVQGVDKNHLVHHSGHYAQDYENNYWHVKFDRSCGDISGQGGWEVASYVASGYQDIHLMGKVANALREAGAKVNDDCGLHVHAEARDLKVRHVGCLVANWLKIEPVVLEMLPRHRRHNRYCRPLREAVNTRRCPDAEHLWEQVRPRGYGNAYRRVALNLCNYSAFVPGRKTLELRLPESTLDGREVKNWIRFYIHFCDVAKKSQFPEDLTPVGVLDTLRLAGLHGDSPFLLLSAGLRETKMWFVRRILQYSGKRKYRDEAEKLLKLLEVEPAPIDFTKTTGNDLTWHKPVKTL